MTDAQPVQTARRTFSLGDQHWFAELSGDRNPMHVDPLAARRLMFGGVVVHGIHMLIWSMDQVLRGGDGPVRLRRLRAIFQKPLLVGQELQCKISQIEQGRWTLSLVSAGVACATVELELADQLKICRAAQPQATAPVNCHDLGMAEIHGKKGDMEVYGDMLKMSDCYTSLSSRMAAWDWARLLACTRLVGMVCPGLHSIFSRIDLEFDGKEAGTPGLLHYQVAKCDERFSQVTMQVRSGDMSGSLVSFLRPRIVEQPACRELSGIVRAGEFAGRTVLVVGGSRGLGELAAKLLALGGARVHLSYCRGADDARRVVTDIRSCGGIAEAMELDALGDLSSLSMFEGGPMDLCYFATPHITPGDKQVFSEALHSHFASYYVTGFERLFRVLEKRGLGRVLYPSTVYVEQAPANLREYAKAKKEGEALCEQLRREFPGIVIHVERYPRLATDQTAGLLSMPAGDTAQTVLESLRRMQGHA